MWMSKKDEGDNQNKTFTPKLVCQTPPTIEKNFSKEEKESFRALRERS